MKPRNSPLDQVAARITAHLLRFESDPTINQHSDVTKTTPYYKPYSIRRGAYVGVRYVSFQGWSNMTRIEAETYLAKLDAGFVGRHWQALKD